MERLGLPNPVLSSSPTREVLDPNNRVEQPITLKHCNYPVVVAVKLRRGAMQGFGRTLAPSSPCRPCNIILGHAPFSTPTKAKNLAAKTREPRCTYIPSPKHLSPLLVPSRSLLVVCLNGGRRSTVVLPEDMILATLRRSSRVLMQGSTQPFPRSQLPPPQPVNIFDVSTPSASH